jgi:hypothetical protein
MLKRLLTPPLIIFAALLMWCEEWLWETLKRVTGWVARFPLIHWYEGAIQRLSPYPMLVVFLLPGLLLFPIKLLAVYWISRGAWLAGLAIIVGAKVLGTAIVARSYVVCHPKLMTIGWFRRAHDWLVSTRDALYAAIRAMRLYQMVRSRLIALRRAIHHLHVRWLGRRGLWTRWLAIRRLHRQRKRRH